MKPDSTIQSTAAAGRRSRMPGVTTQIFIGLALGIVIGYVWPWLGTDIKPLADAFLKMIKMIIAPLLFSTLVVGIAGTGDMKAMGRIGLKAIIYFEVATTIALFWGLALVNWFQPGSRRRDDGGRRHGRPGRAGHEAAGRRGTSSCTCSRRRSSTRWPRTTSCSSSCSRRSSASPWRRSARRASPSSTCSRAPRRRCSSSPAT